MPAIARIATEKQPLQPNRHARRAHVNGESYRRDPADHYIEPYWISERLFEVEAFQGEVHDPCAGVGRIIHAARRAGFYAYGSDLIKRARGIRGGVDFLKSEEPRDNFAFNPPFHLAPAFALHAVQLVVRKIAMVFPTARLNAADGPRSGRWISSIPLRRIWLLSPRPSMPPGDIALEHEKRGEEPAGGTEDYAWLIIERGFTGHAEVRWLHREVA